MAPKREKAAEGPPPTPPPAPEGKCNFFLASKKRHCRFDVCPGQLYCGNHIYLVTQQGEKQVPCPVDPTHTVAESRLKAHVKKCTKYKAQLEERAQPFYCEDVNAGSGDDLDLDTLPEPLQGTEGSAGKAAAAAAAAGAKPLVGNPFLKGRAAYRAAYALRLGDAVLEGLVARVEAAYRQACHGVVPPQHVLLPDECQAVMVHNESRPYSAKHGLQQASILGNMQRLGLLPPPAGCTTLELGAGTGYLSLMLAECFGAAAVGGQQAAVVLVDRRGFKRKADRLLRTKGLCRLKVDIKDLDLGRCPGVQAPGPAQLGSTAASAAPSATSEASATCSGAPWLCIGKHLCGAATDYALRCCLRGAAAAAGQPEGHGSCEEAAAAPAQPAPAREGQGKGTAGGSEALRRMQGLAIAPCCHHRCGWRAYVGKPMFTRLGFTPDEFELVSWMTGWALCGHAAPAGQGPGEDEDAEEEAEVASDDEELPQGGGQGQGPEGGAGGVGPPQGQAGKRLKDETPPSKEGADASKRSRTSGPGGSWDAAASTPHDGAVAGLEQAAMAATVDDAKGYAAALPRDRRIAVGSMCKQLIDQGRLEWLQGLRACCRAELVSYCEPEVSGECRLLLAAMAGTTSLA